MLRRLLGKTFWSSPFLKSKIRLHFPSFTVVIWNNFLVCILYISYHYCIAWSCHCCCCCCCCCCCSWRRWSRSTRARSRSCCATCTPRRSTCCRSTTTPSTSPGRRTARRCSSSTRGSAPGTTRTPPWVPTSAPRLAECVIRGINNILKLNKTKSVITPHLGSRSSQCSATGVTKAVVCVILSVGRCI